MQPLYQAFIEGLSQLYGAFDAGQHRFERASNSEIAKDLGYSIAQFSRLINESATEGEYQRATQTLERVLRVQALEAQLAGRAPAPRPGGAARLGWLASVALLLLVGLLGWRLLLPSEGPGPAEPARDDMLQWVFNSEYVNPYVRLGDLPADCNFPCYKYQGRWNLKNGYKLPFFRERNGFHYQAVAVNMYARCMAEEAVDGRALEGYEYQRHEIWYDLQERAFDTFLEETSSLNGDYQLLDFSTDPNFVKLATVHTFFRNEFTLDSGLIYRTGKVVGRDLEFTPKEALARHIPNEQRLKDLEVELISIARARLQDFSRPITCQQAAVPAANFHAVAEGALMSFDCQLTTNRVSLDYTKTYVLSEQYIQNDCRPDHE